jgi:hypothetical protein
MLSGKVSKFSITVILYVFLDSVSVSVSIVLRDRHQPKSEAVLKVLSLVHCVAMIITSSLFVGFGCMSN